MQTMQDQWLRIEVQSPLAEVSDELPNKAWVSTRFHS